MATDLKPCPFCGGNARHLPFRAGYNGEMAICDVCKVSAHVKIWERRELEAAATDKQGVELAYDSVMDAIDAGLVEIGTFLGMHARNAIARQIGTLFRTTTPKPEASNG